MKLQLYEVRYKQKGLDNGRGLIASNLSRDNTIRRFVEGTDELRDLELVNVGQVILDFRKTTGPWGSFKAADRIEVYLNSGSE